MRDRKFYIGIAVVLVCAVLLFGFSGTLNAQESALAKSLDASQLNGPADDVVIDFTYDSSTGNWSVGGFTLDQLEQLFGFQPLDKNVLGVLSEFGDLHMQLTGTEASINMMDGTQLATIHWDADSRNSVLELLSGYGVNLDKDAVARVEEVLTLLNLNVTLRDSPETSNPLHVALSTLIMADVATNGYLSVEGIDTGLMLNPEVVRIAKMGDIENIIACWDKGTFVTKVNGNDLPTITLYEEGLKVADKAFRLGLGDVMPFLDARLGASVSIADGAHPEDVYCGGGY